nr:hypothetical protein [Tanacetum cinerariifolium]
MDKGEGEEDINSILNNFNFKMSKIADPVRPPVRVSKPQQVHSQDEGDKGGSYVSPTVTQEAEKISEPATKQSGEKVDGAAVSIPLEAVEAVSSPFVNTLYGYFIGKRLAFPLVENYVKNTWAKFGIQRVQLHEEFFLFQCNTKEGMESVLENGPWLIRSEPLMLNIWSHNTDLKKAEVKHAPVWVKLHHVPIVAYSEIRLSLITTQIGKPIMLDSYTSNMCVNSWGRSTYARALIEVSAEVELKDELIIAIPVGKVKGHSLATISIEYEWRPPRCSTCLIFDHSSDKCLKLPKEIQMESVTNDGFEVVKKKKKNKGKNKQQKQVDGVRLNKPALNLHYRRVEKGETSKQNLNGNNSDTTYKESTPSTLNTENIPVSNSFTALNDEDAQWATVENTTINDSDSEDVDEKLVMEDRKKSTMKSDTEGASTLDANVVNVDSKLMKICTYVFGHWDWTSNGTWCSKGSRIILGWNRNDVDASVITQDDQVIHTRIWLNADRKELFCSFIYAHNRYTHRRSLWQNMEMHKVYIRQRPWCLLGDFNAALTLDDMLTGSSTIDISMREFKECVDNIEFMDIQKTGGHAIFQPYRISDHSPAVLCLPTTVKAKPKPFKFSNILIQNSRFKQVVMEGWNRDVSGFNMYKAVLKLRHLKKPLRKLMFDNGNLHDNVKRPRHELDMVQRDLDNDPFNITLREEEVVYVQAFNEAILLEERFLIQKAKVDWLRDGDSNSAYFHKSVKSRISRSRIDVITNSEGLIFENEKVADAFVSHYEVFLGQPGNVSPICTTNLFLNRLDSAAALEMVRDINDQEVKEAMFSIGNDKSPGPDGFTAAFFKGAWDIVANDVPNAVQEFFINGKLVKELNHTILLPYKIIANRIKESLKVLVSANQSVFVPGRNISDNILLIQELMHNYHLDRGPPRCAFKVDIQKAYDTVDWTFLQEVLLGFGFHVRLVGWIMECVTTTSFSISINGSLHGYFKGKRDLRQGDPLSPYLFTLVMEVSTLMLRKRVQASDSFSYHRYCSKLELVNLCFVDDLFLFAHGDANSTRVIMEALDDFKQVSGLIPSLSKSTAYFCNVLNHVKLSILQILPFEEGDLPVKYLGVPLVSSRLIYRDCKELIEKVQARVDNWKNKLLSTARRLQLIQSVIGSLHVFWASVFVLPSRILLDIEQIMRGFLWSHGNLHKGHAKVAWDVICLPKTEGGLGIRRLDVFNKSSMVTHIWKLINNKESLWVQWIHAYKLQSRNFGMFRIGGGFNQRTKLDEMISNGVFLWPNEWYVKYPLLNTLAPLAIILDRCDKLEWFDVDGTVQPCFVHTVWNSIRSRSAKVIWSSSDIQLDSMLYLNPPVLHPTPPEKVKASGGTRTRDLL